MNMKTYALVVLTVGFCDADQVIVATHPLRPCVFALKSV